MEEELVERGFWNSGDSFIYTDSLAWEQDFKCLTCPGGGYDYEFIDDVTIAYFNGHGVTDSSAFMFGAQSIDDWHLTGQTDARWGDDNNGYLNWIGIKASYIPGPDEEAWDNWVWPVFKGLHLLLGHATTLTNVSNHGEIWAERMTDYDDTIINAWYKACLDTQSSSRIVHPMGVSVEWPPETWDDKLLQDFLAADPYPYSWGFDWEGPC